MEDLSRIRELPVWARELQQVVFAITESVPEYLYEETQTTRGYGKAVDSRERIPGYSTEPLYSFASYDSDADNRLALVRLPGPPADDGSPTVRDYLVSRRNDRGSPCVELRIYKFTLPRIFERIANIAVGSIVDSDDAAGFRDQTIQAIDETLAARLAKNDPIQIGKMQTLDADGINALTSELEQIRASLASLA